MSVDMSSTSLPASSLAAGSCDSSASASSIGSASSSSGSTAGSVLNWRAGSESASTSGFFPTERLLRSDTYRWWYGRGHTASCENESSSTRRNSSTGSSSGETQVSTKGTMKARDRVVFSMSINCCEVRRQQASAAGFSRPGTFLEQLGPACLSWCQRSRACLEITKAFMVGVHMYLLWSSK